MKSTVFSALTSDRELVFLVGKIQNPDNSSQSIPSIFYDTPSSWNSLPAVSFFEIKCEDSLFADDACIGQTITFRIDIWNSGSVSAIFKRVDTIMRQLGFSCIASEDIPDTNIKHKQAKYSIFKSV